MTWQLSGRHHGDRAIDESSGLPARHGEIVMGLQIQPEFGRGIEIPSEAQGGISRYRSLAVDDPRDAIGRHLQRFGEGVGSHTDFVEEFGFQDFTGMDWGTHGCFSSVVIDYFDIKDVAAAPDETDPELAIDPNAELAGTVAGQLFKAIRWRRSQVSKVRRRVQHEHFCVSTFQYGSRHDIWAIAVEDRARPVTSPRLDRHEQKVWEASLVTSSVTTMNSRTIAA